MQHIATQDEAGPAGNDEMAAHLASKPTLTNIVNQAGLGEIAKAIEGDTYVVCDPNSHAVQGCADMRSAMQNQQMAAELVAIGLAIVVATFVGMIGVGFIKLVTLIAHPVGQHRVYALFPKRRTKRHEGELPWKA